MGCLIPHPVVRVSNGKNRGVMSESALLEHTVAADRAATRVCEPAAAARSKTLKSLSVDTARRDGPDDPDSDEIDRGGGSGNSGGGPE
jgi:hypothetical protein